MVDLFGHQMSVFDAIVIKVALGAENVAAGSVERRKKQNFSKNTQICLTWGGGDMIVLVY